MPNLSLRSFQPQNEKVDPIARYIRTGMTNGTSLIIIIIKDFECCCKWMPDGQYTVYEIIIWSQVVAMLQQTLIEL